MKKTRYLLLPVLIMMALLSACDRQAPSPAKPESQEKIPVNSGGKTFRLENSFNVGQEVVVRSLAVDNASKSIWVGTSVGVIEVDLASQQPKNTFTRKDGLANEYVFATGIDSQGYKWFGTNAGGVSRYRDGEWKTYFPMHGLADYWVYAFAEQKSGGFWIGTWAGANHVDLQSMKFTTYLKELINEWVYGIAIDSHDRVWFGTEGGVSMFDGVNWKHWKHTDGLGGENSRQLPLSQNTGLGTRSRHDLNVLVDGGESYNPNYVFSMLVTPNDIIWAGTWGGGAGAYDGKQWKNYTQADGLAGNIVYCIAQDESGVLWFGTNHGVSRYDGKTWQTYNQQDGLLGNDVYALAVEPGGKIWIGTKHGVSVLKK